MKFWDSSALLPIVIEESTSKSTHKIFASDHEMIVWWGSETECLSAIARRGREKSLTFSEQKTAERLLKELLCFAIEVKPSSEIKKIAERLLYTHPLRAADALQLAAAMLFAGENLAELTIVTLDDRLRCCAQSEGFKILP